MKRSIITPPDLSGAPLGELKQWLAISTNHEDAALQRLIAAALDLCEAFTGQMPLASECEDVLPVLARWQTLSVRPVNAITQVETVPVEGLRAPLDIADYEIDIDASGNGCVRVVRSPGASRIAVRYSAGLANDWGQLPDAMRHGIVRLAAASYRSRDSDAAANVPVAVAALWQPWRQMRLA